jgi:hypothetical protein
MDKQSRGEYEQISERDKEIQASFWAMIFLTSEMALAFRALRDKLQARGSLLPEDNAAIDQIASSGENLRRAYEHIEHAFREKYERVRTAMDSPAEVTEVVHKQQARETIDLNKPQFKIVTDMK